MFPINTNSKRLYGQNNEIKVELEYWVNLVTSGPDMWQS